MNSKRLSRIAMMAIAAIAGIAFIVLAIETLDFSPDDVVKQFIGIIILVLFIMGAAALFALLVRAIVNRINNDKK